ncbi:MAG TPA: glycosyltransferase 87 family protein [Aggregatilineaceae bacterium]|nr:glycosyltransferase 87 family protein [Aggregatilineaceae bacterium]
MFKNFYDSRVLRQIWSESALFRRGLIVVAIYAVLRLLMQLYVINDPELFPDDLRIYLDAARDLRNEQDLYPPLPLEHMEFYQYAPSFALAFVPFTWIPKMGAAVLHTFLHLIIYALLYTRWDTIFKRYDMPQARRVLVWTLPVWLVFSAFWNDIAYLNIYLFLALIATLLIEAVMEKRLGWSVVWLAIILQCKPQWAFAALLPLLLGEYRFFFKLAVWSLGVYLAIVGITILAVGPAYGWDQHKEYVHLLTGISGNYPWRGPDKPFLGYNHSLVQTAVYLFGDHTDVITGAKVIKLLLLAPLALVCIRCLRNPKAARETPISFSLDLALALYTAAFVWIDVIWELSLGIAVFTYLLATMSRRRLRNGIAAVFLVYAVIDFWQIMSYTILGDAVVDEGWYVRTDPSLYIPLVLIVTLLFYSVLVARLWQATANFTEHRAAAY